MTEQQLRKAKQSAVQDTFSMRSLAHGRQTYSLLLKYPGKIGNTYPNERRQVECYEQANKPSRSNYESVKPADQEEPKPVKISGSPATIHQEIFLTISTSFRWVNHSDARW
jgi:hypothetical protein